MSEPTAYASTGVPSPYAGYDLIGENRHRERVGFYYEEFEPGAVFEHRPGRTVTEMDNVLMSTMAMNQSPLHIDAAFCDETEWGRPLVSSLVTLSIVCGMSVRSTSGRGIANLGWDSIRLAKPVFVGDTLYSESEILGKRRSRSRENRGIVTVRTTGVNQNGEIVITFERSFMVPTMKKD
ncbi:MaoC family dehydratase [Actinomadura sp. 9N215]|uniref:MaoC family dehydratase n=1 Tax=Actinomadura sp. 9N215 TaxID=3375150 RepID=UPI0037AA1384